MEVALVSHEGPLLNMIWLKLINELGIGVRCSCFKEAVWTERLWGSDLLVRWELHGAYFALLCDRGPVWPLMKVYLCVRIQDKS